MSPSLRPALAVAFLVASLLIDAPAGASLRPRAGSGAADPGRSHVMVQAPALAPGAMGTAPLYGELRPDGTFVLHAPIAQAQTGNAVQDTLLRRFVPGTVSLLAESPQLVRRLPDGHTMHATGTVYAAGTARRVPLFVRVTRGPQGARLRTYFRLPLASYGVAHPRGGPAGDVRVAIEATFPR